MKHKHKNRNLMGFYKVGESYVNLQAIDCLSYRLDCVKNMFFIIVTMRSGVVKEIPISFQIKNYGEIKDELDRMCDLITQAVDADQHW